MKTIFLIFISLITFSCTSKLDSSDLNLKTTAQLVQELSSDTMDGRCPGTIGFEKAAFCVENYMKAIGIKPFISGSYHDSLKVKDAVSFNLVGVIESKKPVNDYIVLSAHLDHLKKGDLKNMTDSIYNGANDNASGVVAVLQIAKELNKFKFDKNIIVALFTGEESGLSGSRHLAKRLKRNKINISYVVNIDMIGTPLTVSANSVYTTGFYLSDFAEVSNALLGEEFILHADRIYDQLDFMSSDNYPFFEEYHIPTSTIITYDKQNYPYYHTVKDEFSKLNIQNMDIIITKVSRLIVLLLRNNSVITLKEPNLQPIDLLKNLPATK